ncbi:MAG: TetR family transcriptional regulator C-terminal domain-containing protein [Pikeienuella sp.]
MAQRKQTRLQTENRKTILAAALEVFARDGFRGATVDAIAKAAGMSKPNLLYYYPNKNDVYRTVLEGLLDTWLDPLRELDAEGEPLAEIASYLERKIHLARNFPMESRLFANEMLRGAPILKEVLEGDLKPLVDSKVAVISAWINAGKLAPIDPYHLIFAIWSTTQHYADFDAQVTAIVGNESGRFDDAAAALKQIFLYGLAPR